MSERHKHGVIKKLPDYVPGDSNSRPKPDKTPEVITNFLGKPKVVDAGPSEESKQEEVYEYESDYPSSD